MSVGRPWPPAYGSGRRRNCDDRKNAAEAKFKHDQEFQFKVNARRNKLLGLWAAGLMGLDGADAEAYAKQVVVSDFDEPGDNDVLRKVSGERNRGATPNGASAPRSQSAGRQRIAQAKREPRTEGPAWPEPAGVGERRPIPS